jgi:hypothetical protein
MYRDLEVILDRVKELINGMKKDMKDCGVLKRFDKSPSLDKWPRYLAVWKLVQKRNQEKWPFYKIVAELRQDGWYQKQTLKLSSPRL